jgi:hypothetical protein
MTIINFIMWTRWEFLIPCCVCVCMLLFFFAYFFGFVSYQGLKLIEYFSRNSPSTGKLVANEGSLNNNGGQANNFDSQRVVPLVDVVFVVGAVLCMCVCVFWKSKRDRERPVWCECICVSVFSVNTCHRNKNKRESKAKTLYRSESRKSSAARQQFVFLLRCFAFCASALFHFVCHFLQ